MSIVLKSLVPEFRSKVDILLANCQARGITMRPNEGLRSTYRQAIYWRQSRSWSKEINPKINRLKKDEAEFLAYCLDAVGPRYGPHVTNAIPGLSWHQWGEALDCVWVIGEKESWSLDKLVNGNNGFRVYAEEAENLGLTAGGHWADFKDWPHVQMRADPSPLEYYSMAEIDDIMYERFPHTYLAGM